MKQVDFKEKMNLLSWKQEKKSQKQEKIYFTLIYDSAVTRTQGLVHAKSFYH